MFSNPESVSLPSPDAVVLRVAVTKPAESSKLTRSVLAPPISWSSPVPPLTVSSPSRAVEAREASDGALIAVGATVD